MVNPYYWNSAQVYGVSSVERTMELYAVPRPRPLHDWVMAAQPTELLWPVVFPQAQEYLPRPSGSTTYGEEAENRVT
jgi:hypothetical protein